MAGDIPLFHVDAFTDQTFRGNGAAVCLLPAGSKASDEWRQGLARDLNQSETAFVEPEGDHFRLRWFTPTAEVDLCGHATLASAHVLWEQGRLRREAPATFETRSGRLSCIRTAQGITMDFPDESVEPAQAPPGLWEALGIKPAPIFRNRLDFLVVLSSEDAVRMLRPDFSSLGRISAARGFIVTAKSSDKDFDYVLRYFAPAFGIDEDPATGSVQCALGPFWAKEFRKHELRARQLSRRGATMGVRPEGKRVHITGACVTVMEGILTARAAPGAKAILAQ
jgi:PhzF family phenazine biosynthesis protein